MRYSESEISEIKKIDIVSFLEASGHKPLRKTNGKAICYRSPIRNERTGSFYAYPQSNTWFDFGSGKGGSVIQLCMEINNISFGEACKMLLGGKLPERSIEEWKEPEPAIKIISIGPITSSWIKQYLSKRCIPLSVADEYTKQARIELKNQEGIPYRKTVIAFPNSKGGYEFRNSKTKIGSRPKYTTTINANKYTALIFEGLFDFLSWITLYGYKDDFTYITLNSAALIDYVPISDYKHVLYFGDADAAGDVVLQKIKDKTEVTDMRYTYHGEKDLNAYLQSIKSCQSLYDQEKNKLI